MQEKTTREAIIEEGLTQAVVVGLEGISMGDVAASIKLSKSGLFTHFKSKEALQLAILEEAVDRFIQRVVAPAYRAASPVERLEKLFYGYLDWIKGDRKSGGCLFITAIQEFDDRPGAVREKLVSSQLAWRRELASTIQSAIAAGELPKKTEVDGVVFRLIGIGLAYQHALKLFHDRNARTLAEQAFVQLRDGA